MNDDRISDTVEKAASSIGRRLALGSASLALNQILVAAQTIALVPLFIRAWGARSYGAWVGLTAILFYLALLDLGGQNYIQNLMSIEWTRGNVERLRIVFASGLSLFVLLALLLDILSASILWVLLPIAGFTHPSPIAGDSASWVVFLIATSVLLGVPGGIFVSVYRATGRFVRAAMIGNISKLVEISLYVTLLLCNARPTLFALGMLAATVFRIALTVIDATLYVPEIRGVRLSPRAAWMGKTHLSQSLQFWLISVSNTLNQQGVLIVVTLFAGPLAVAAYATHRTASGLLNYAGLLAQGPLWPEFTHMWASGQEGEIRRLALRTIRIVMLSAALSALLVWFALPLFYPLWTGRHLHFMRPLLAVMLVQGVLASGWNTAGWSLLAANHQKWVAWWTAGNGATTVLLALLLVRPFGLVGVALASLAGDIACGLAVFPTLAARFLKARVRGIYGEIARVSSLTATVAAAGVLAGLVIPAPILLASAGAAVIGVPVLTAGAFLLKADRPVRRVFEWMMGS